MPQGLGLLRTEPRPRSRAPAPPRLKSGAAGSEAPAHKPPLAPECLVPCGWEPIPDPGGLSYISSKLRTPTKRWTSAPGELRKVITCSPGFLGPGPPAASVLGSHSACGRQRHQHRRSGGAGHFWERGRYGGKSFQTRTLGLFLPAHSTGSYHSGHHFLQGSGCPTPPSWARRRAAALWTFSRTTSARAELREAESQSLRASKDPSPQATSWGRSSEKNSRGS